MPGVAAIHHALREINSGASDVRSLIDILDGGHRAAVDSHSHWQRWIERAKRPRDLHRTTHRRFRCCKKNQRHAVAGRQPDKFPVRFGGLNFAACRATTAFKSRTAAC